MSHATFVDSNHPDLLTLPDDSTVSRLGTGPRFVRGAAYRKARLAGRKSTWYVLSIGVAGQVAELADALDLESSGATRQSSSLCLPTPKEKERTDSRVQVNF